jgi:hypothetical protein
MNSVLPLALLLAACLKRGSRYSAKRHNTESCCLVRVLKAQMMCRWKSAGSLLMTDPSSCARYIQYLHV